MGRVVIGCIGYSAVHSLVIGESYDRYAGGMKIFGLVYVLIFYVAEGREYWDELLLASGGCLVLSLGISGAERSGVLLD